MNTKRNEFLDFEDDEDASTGSIEAEEESRTLRFANPPAKRRKIDSKTDLITSDQSEDESHHEDSHDQIEPGSVPSDRKERPTEEDIEEPTKKLHETKLRPFNAAQLAAAQKKVRKTGVLYISRIPPFMKPSTIRQLLSPYGDLLRVFLTPEPAPAHAKRVKAGGNKKRSFIDGWVEFASKKRAKICAETLNGNTIGGKKGSWYRDDIWNVKYLRGFKWDDLMEQVSREEKMREARLRAELQREARERKAFMRNYDAAKKERGIESRRRLKRKAGRGDVQRVVDDKQEDDEAKANASQLKTERIYRQKKARVKEDTNERKALSESVRRVLSKIF